MTSSVHIHLALAVLPWALCLALYVECARRTLQNIILSAPEGSLEPLVLAARSGRLPPGVAVLWFFLWVPYLILGWLLTRRIRASELRGETHPLSVK